MTECDGCRRLRERLKSVEFRLDLREKEIAGLKETDDCWRGEFIRQLKVELGLDKPLTRCVGTATIGGVNDGEQFPLQGGVR